MAPHIYNISNGETKMTNKFLQEIEANEEIFCARCDRELTGKAVWMELDTRTGIFTQKENIPEEHSQGWYPFGTTCAKKEKAKAAKAA